MTGSDPTSDRSPEWEEMAALLPFYVTGRLSADDAGKVAAWIEEHKEAQALIDDIRAEMSASAAANEAIEPPPHAFTRLMNAVEAVAAEERIAAGRDREPSAGLGGRLRRFFKTTPAAVAWGLCAALLVIAIVEGIYLTAVAPPYRPEIAGSTDGALAANAIVAFVPDATAADIRTVLVDIRASIVSGPRADGYYEIALDDDPALAPVAVRLESLAARKDVILFAAGIGDR